MSYIEKEKLIKADIASIENRVRHAFNQGYDLGFKDGKEKAKPLEQESTTKNDSPKYCDRSICFKNEYNNVSCEDCEVTKSQEPTTKNDIRDCKSCVYSKDGKCAGTEECHLCMWENQYTPTTKNNLGVDCISREDALMCLTGKFENREYEPSELIKMSARRIKALPPVTPQEPKTGHWIRISPAKIYECSECDKNVMTSDICLYKFCHRCGAKMVEPSQESEET